MKMSSTINGKPALEAVDPRVDIYVVAEHAGVSPSTVSRVMNGLPSVNRKLAAKVWKAVSELNYRPNLQARSLGSGRSRLLGLIVTDLGNPFFPDLIRSFERHAVKSGYEILIGCVSEDLENIDRCLQRMSERSVEGIAALTFGLHQEITELLVEKQVPIVFANYQAPLPNSMCLNVNYRDGYREAVQHLGFLGHRKIGFLAGPLDDTTTVAVARFDAFMTAAREIGVEVPSKWIFEGDFTLESGIAITEKLLQQQDRATAIVCTNDVGAIGALHAVMNHGLMVPKDLSVIGFDNIHLSKYTYPPLTTIEMSPDQLSEHAIQALIEVIEGRKPSSTHTVLTKLILRRTTGPPMTNQPRAIRRRVRVNS